MQRVVVAVAVVVGCSQHYELQLGGAFGDAETIRGTERSTESQYWTDDDAAPGSALSVNCLGET